MNFQLPHRFRREVSPLTAVPSPDAVRCGLSPRQLDQVFPFHVVLRSDGSIEQLGPGIVRSCSLLAVESAFDDHFIVRRPHVEGGFDYPTFACLTRAPFVVALRAYDLELEGQVVVSQDSARLLFLGSPTSKSLEKLIGMGLRPADLAPHELPLERHRAKIEASRLRLALAEERRKVAELEEESKRRNDREQQLRAGDEGVVARLAEVERLESLGILAGGIAHDFNNLLMRISANVDVARGHIGPDTDDVGAPLDEIVDAAGAAAALCDELLAYAGKAETVPEAQDLGRLVFDLGPQVRRSLPERVDLVMEAPELPLAVEIDAARIRQTVLSLTTNSLEALGDSRGRIAVRTGQVALTRSDLEQLLLGDVAEAGEFAFVEVNDNGEGMNAETLERLFDPFFSTRFLGRGLGLSAVFGIVRHHQGCIEVESKEGVGTRVRLLLPTT